MPGIIAAYAVASFWEAVRMAGMHTIVELQKTCDAAPAQWRGKTTDGLDVFRFIATLDFPGITEPTYTTP